MDTSNYQMTQRTKFGSLDLKALIITSKESENHRSSKDNNNNIGSTQNSNAIVVEKSSNNKTIIRSTAHSNSEAGQKLENIVDVEKKDNTSKFHFANPNKQQQSTNESIFSDLNAIVLAKLNENSERTRKAANKALQSNGSSDNSYNSTVEKITATTISAIIATTNNLKNTSTNSNELDASSKHSSIPDTNSSKIASNTIITTIGAIIGNALESAKKASSNESIKLNSSETTKTTSEASKIPATRPSMTPNVEFKQQQQQAKPKIELLSTASSVDKSSDKQSSSLRKPSQEDSERSSESRRSDLRLFDLPKIYVKPMKEQTATTTTNTKKAEENTSSENETKKKAKTAAAVNSSKIPSISVRPSSESGKTNGNDSNSTTTTTTATTTTNQQRGVTVTSLKSKESKRGRGGQSDDEEENKDFNSIMFVADEDDEITEEIEKIASFDQTTESYTESSDDNVELTLVNEKYIGKMRDETGKTKGKSIIIIKKEDLRVSEKAKPTVRSAPSPAILKDVTVTQQSNEKKLIVNGEKKRAEKPTVGEIKQINVPSNGDEKQMEAKKMAPNVFDYSPFEAKIFTNDLDYVYSNYKCNDAKLNVPCKENETKMSSLEKRLLSGTLNEEKLKPKHCDESSIPSSGTPNMSSIDSSSNNSDSGRSQHNNEQPLRKLATPPPPPLKAKDDHHNQQQHQQQQQHETNGRTNNLIFTNGMEGNTKLNERKKDEESAFTQPKASLTTSIRDGKVEKPIRVNHGMPPPPPALTAKNKKPTTTTTTNGASGEENGAESKGKTFINIISGTNNHHHHNQAVNKQSKADEASSEKSTIIHCSNGKQTTTTTTPAEQKLLNEYGATKASSTPPPLLSNATTTGTTSSENNSSQNNDSTSNNTTNTTGVKVAPDSNNTNTNNVNQIKFGNQDEYFLKELNNLISGPTCLINNVRASKGEDKLLNLKDLENYNQNKKYFNDEKTGLNLKNLIVNGVNKVVKNRNDFGLSTNLPQLGGIDYIFKTSDDK